MKTDNLSYERYQRQVILKDFGNAGQQKLLKAKVLVIGAGGLGCPALQYLVAAGVGNIGIADDDTVSLSNLHRQVLYTTFDIGYLKAVVAKHNLVRLNPDISITTHTERVTTKNALEIIGLYDIVIDGTDNFSSRYLINDACVLLDKPLVYGAVSQFEGQVAIFNCRSGDGITPVNYRDLFPEPPRESEVANCAEAGVLGVLPGIIGTMQANETIKLISGIGQPLVNMLLTYNALNNRLYELSLTARIETRSLVPLTTDAFRKMDYDWLCASSASTRFEIDGLKFDQLIGGKIATIIDVREPGELPALTGIKYSRIPLSQIREKIPAIEADKVVVFCQTGKRSLQAAQLLAESFGDSKKIFSLKNGITEWLILNPNHQL